MGAEWTGGAALGPLLVRMEAEAFHLKALEHLCSGEHTVRECYLLWSVALSLARVFSRGDSLSTVLELL